jgi:UPF0755 protein
VTSGERSPEERERARLEREARRAARGGAPQSQAPATGSAASGGEPGAPRPPRAAPKPLRRLRKLPWRPRKPTWRLRKPPSHEPPVAGEGRAPQPPSPPRKPPPYQPPPSYDAPPPPAGTSHPRTFGRGAAARRAAADRILQRRRGRNGGASRRGRFAAAAGVVVAIVLAWFLVSLFQPFKGDGEGRVRVVIPRGAGVEDVADLLAERDVVSSAFFFKVRARLTGRQDELKAGTFDLKKGMSHSAAIDAIAKAPPPDVVRITVPEGRSRRELAPTIDRSLRGSYLAATRRSSLLDPRAYGAKGARDLEGFLFPATYDVKRGRTATDLVRQQLDVFEREIAKVDLRPARRRNRTPYDVLIVASMVEREAQVARERPIIASVIYNRLREGVPLGIDATVRFAVHNWSRPLRRSEIEINSPYNTRRRRGLPPGPIGSPGLASIRAAANPARTGFVYFVVKPGTCGEHKFSRTLAGFRRDEARYNRERARRGGKSPTRC